jgi:cysteine-rich repeat protein
MRSPVLLLVPALVLLVAIPASEAKKAKYVACSDRYVVSGASAIGADSAPDPVILSIQGKQVGIGHCTARAASVKASKKGTTVVATWKACDAALKKVHLTAKLPPDCSTLTGSVSAKKVPKESFSATRSNCGDGVVDAGRGESCDGSQGCSEGETTCGSDCACHVNTTTTVPSVSTTVTTIMEGPSTTTSTTLIGHCTQTGAQCTTERDDCPPIDPSKCGGSVTSGCQGCCGNGGEPEPGETCDKGPDNCPTTGLPCGSGCTADCRAVGECTVTRAQCLTNADCGGPAGQTCCGNGIIESGETCDDGNTVDGDSCPASCHVDPCVPVPGTLAASVRYTGPAGTIISGLGFFVDYPAGKVTSPAVTGAFGVSQTDTQYGYGFNDEALKLGGLPATFLHVTFQQLCQGAAPATAADFTCTVNDASDDAGNVVPASQVTCTVTVP